MKIQLPVQWTLSTHHSGTVKSAPPGGWPYILVSETHPLPRDSKKCPTWWVDMLQWRTHSPTVQGLPPPTGGGSPCTVGRVRFPHRYKPRSVLPPPAYS